jgi:hypothetical protein
LHEHADGRFVDEVKHFYGRTESNFYARAYDHPALLRVYLRNLPNGPHASAVSARLDEFALLDERRRAREQRENQNFNRIANSLAEAEAGRSRLVAKVVELVRLLAATRSFGQPTSELADQLIYQFRLEEPRGHCDDDGCRKQFHLEFAVPEGGGLRARTLELTLEIGLDRGLVRSVSVSGAQLFSRLAEAVDRRPVNDRDWQARMDAIGRAVQVLENALEEALPASECRRDPVAPWIVWRACRSVTFRAAAATEAGQLDRFEVVSTP